MKLENTIEIKASMAHIWAVTYDIENWPQWTPTISSVKKCDREQTAVGSKAWVKQPAMKKTEWTITALNEPECFVWTARIFGMPSVATHTIFEKEGKTYNRLGFEMTGQLARLLGPILRPQLQKALIIENKGLKAFCEASYSQRTSCDQLLA